MEQLGSRASCLSYGKVIVACSTMVWNTRCQAHSELGLPMRPAGDTPAELVNRWGQATLDHYMGLYFSTEAAEAGGAAHQTVMLRHVGRGALGRCSYTGTYL